MQITQVSVTRKFNLGNYQTLDIGLVATINETDSPKEVAGCLDEKIIEIRNKKIDLKA